MQTGLAAVGQNVSIVAAGFFEGVSQDGEAVKGPVVVDALGDGAHQPVVPEPPNRLPVKLTAVINQHRGL